MAQIDDDSSRSVMIGQDRAEQPTGRSHVATQRYARCDDLAMLVNSAVHLSPNGSGFHLGVINKPMAANQMPTRLCHSDSTGARCPKPQHLAASLEVLVAYEASLCMRYGGGRDPTVLLPSRPLKPPQRPWPYPAHGGEAGRNRLSTARCVRCARSYRDRRSATGRGAG